MEVLGLEIQYLLDVQDFSALGLEILIDPWPYNQDGSPYDPTQTGAQAGIRTTREGNEV